MSEEDNSLGPVQKTNRGFEYITFNDAYGCKSSLQQSSSASSPHIWLGISNAEPKVLATNAYKVGVTTNQRTGWVDYPIPDEVFLTTRMHLNQDQVRLLINHLQHWLDTGKLQ